MFLIAKNIKRYFSLKELIIVLLAVIISISAGIGVFASLKKEVLVNDTGKQISIKTMKATVGEALEQNGIAVTTYDYISVPPNTKLQRINKDVINIKRAIPVNIIADGKKTVVMTYKDTVKETLLNSPVKMAASDKLDGVSPDDRVVKNMDIKVIRVIQEFVTDKISIPFKVETRENNKMDKGTEKIVREGKEGIREKLYKVVFEDGKQVLKELVKDTVTLNPVAKLIELGTILNYITARGDIFRYKSVLDMRATAYTASFKDTGKHPDDPGFGITYTGVRAKRGIIAVDPRVIPLGTRVYVEVAGSTPDYGYAVAADIGGAIKGKLIDLYFDNQNTVDRWGCKKVKVYVLIN